MISRQWRGVAKLPHADDYVEHLRSETFPQLSKIAGFIDATILKRNVRQGVEFLIVTRWESIGAIEQFAGLDAEVAVVPGKVQEMMIEYDHRVRHYEVLSNPTHREEASVAED
jgi:heme-degrading monooxygenase HmoA